VFPVTDNLRLNRFPIVTVGLIAANVLAYLLAVRHGGSLLGGPSTQTLLDLAAIPRALTHPGQHCTLALGGRGAVCAAQAAPRGALPTWLTPLSSMFLHANALHLLGNMLFLAIFGPTLEDSLGRVRYGAFYVVGGLVALGAQVAIDPDLAAPTLGASGAIAAVLGGYVLLYPRARVLTVSLIVLFFTVVELPALALLALWGAEQVYFAAAGLSDPVVSGGVIAYFAYLGGFLFGCAVIGRLVVERKAVPPVPGGPRRRALA
jgi:membrane associated rhomboid family serine protease